MHNNLDHIAYLQRTQYQQYSTQHETNIIDIEKLNIDDPQEKLTKNDKILKVFVEKLEIRSIITLIQQDLQGWKAHPLNRRRQPN